MIVAVTGWRHYEDREFIWRHLDDMLRWHEEQGAMMYLRVGDATGADEITAMWYQQRGQKENSQFLAMTKYFADWEGRGKAAGPERNLRMLTKEPLWVPSQQRQVERDRLADYVLGFPQPFTMGKVPGSGTWGCLMTAALLGIEIRVPAYQRGE